MLTKEQFLRIHVEGMKAAAIPINEDLLYYNATKNGNPFYVTMTDVIIFVAEYHAFRTIRNLTEPEDEEETRDAIEGEYQGALASSREAPEHQLYHQVQAEIYKGWLDQHEED